MARMNVRTAAEYARKSYKPHKYPELRIARSLDQNGVQAMMTTDGILLLPGSNGIMDYIRFNLRVFYVGGKKYALHSSETEEGASKTIWHQGFLRYARVVYEWAKDDKPVMIVGHSLGAAAAQILGPSFRVPAICFASPRPLKGTLNAPLSRYASRCLSICRSDDKVCRLPGSYSHIGDARVLTPTKFSFGLGHSMKQYLKVLRSNKGPDRIPAVWP